MATALECWSGSNTHDDEVVEQVLMKDQDRSESFPSLAREISGVQRKWQRLGRNFTDAFAVLKNTLNLDAVKDSTMKIESNRKLIWGSVIRNLTQLYPGSQLPEKLVSNIRKHFDSLPLSYAQANFEMKDVFLHIRLIEQATVDDRPAIFIQEDEMQGSMKLTFACVSSISWPNVANTLDTTVISCKKIQIFEKKGLTLGVVNLVIQTGYEKLFKSRIENALKLASRKQKPVAVKLPFGLCGCQEENFMCRERETDEGTDGDNQDVNLCTKFQLQNPLPDSTICVSVNEWQTVQVGSDEISKWVLNAEHMEILERTGPNSYKGIYRGKKVMIKKIRGCERGISYEFEVRRDLLELMTCGHKKILQFYGIFIDDNHGLCIVTKLMEGGSVHEIIKRSKRLLSKEIIKIASDIAEGIMFMNSHGVSYRDLNTRRILLDKSGNACVGDMGIISASKNVGDVTEYETAGYRWLAPEIIAGDPECVKETWMSNVYSFGMVMWEMVAGQVAYGSYSPVQAAVGIAACGLRPEIPKDCSQLLKSLMIKCWNNSPSKRPNFQEILSILNRPSSISR